MKVSRLAALAMAALGCRQSSPPVDPNDPPPVLSAADREALRSLAPPSLPAPPPDAANRFADDPRAAALGQKLFFDAGFSGKLLDGDNDGSAFTLGVKGETGKVSCAGCHIPSAGFVDNRTRGGQITLAAGWVLRRTPSLLDVAQSRLLMWDGRRDAFYNQVFGPVENPVEMNSSRLYFALQIAARYAAEYAALFGPLPDTSRWPLLDAAHTGCDTAKPPVCHGMPGDHAEFDGLSAADQDAVAQVVANAGRALGAYQRLLACGPGRIDRWVNGDAGALTNGEQRGAAVFIGKGKCITCHSGPYLSDHQFHNVGLAPASVAQENFIDLGDRGAATGLPAAIADALNTRGKYSDGNDGRLPAEVPPAMEGAFKTPGLRCLGRRPSFMHTGQMAAIEDVVAFFDRGGHPAGYPGKSEIAPLGLTDGEKRDLGAFLRTLEGPGPAAALLVAP